MSSDGKTPPDTGTPTTKERVPTDVENLQTMRGHLIRRRRELVMGALNDLPGMHAWATRLKEYQELIEALDRSMADEVNVVASAAQSTAMP